jgi:hypothetical protein
MEQKVIGFFFFCFAIVLMACEKPETPAVPYERGGTSEISIAMGDNYDFQIYFNLEKNEIVKIVDKMDWDWAIASSDKAIVLNTSRNMLAAKTKLTSLDLVNDTAGLKFEMDYATGNRDSLSIGLIDNSKLVYVIWLGYNVSGDDLGYIKAQFEWTSASTCIFTYGELKSKSYKTGQLVRDDNYNHVFYSFMNHRNVEIEPVKTKYDLLFTQYLYYFLEPEITPYLVAGALLNPYKTKANRMPNTKFITTVLADTLKYPLSGAYDVIGYNWKGFSLSENAYTIVPDINFIIQDQNDFFYKLRFVDFYNEKGIKGTPKFEFGKI